MKTKQIVKHTPGPWGIHNNIGSKSEMGVVANKAPFIIAAMGNQKAWPIEAMANARLIAACPIMYDFIQSKAREGDKNAKEIIDSINK